ncbi:hypothetical protein KFK09_017439 [Dendrobium nobile]|uniref:Uncharacterized protein n=1 Tax=Dendrobium nobile TaxID=94219 RepID=A0A8T3B101_DENNO|nr:hypothetical protein KFK09_017439 [Dendrobium nobile]
MNQYMNVIFNSYFELIHFCEYKLIKFHYFCDHYMNYKGHYFQVTELSPVLSFSEHLGILIFTPIGLYCNSIFESGFFILVKFHSNIYISFLGGFFAGISFKNFPILITRYVYFGLLFPFSASIIFAGRLS